MAFTGQFGVGFSDGTTGGRCSLTRAVCCASWSRRRGGRWRRRLVIPVRRACSDVLAFTGGVGEHSATRDP
jgi:hypothetical protein